MKRLVMTFGLTCVLSISTLAGNIPTVPGPPPSPQGTRNATSPGQIPTVPGDVPTGGSAEQLSSTALSALLTVLGLLSV